MKMILLSIALGCWVPIVSGRAATSSLPSVSIHADYNTVRLQMRGGIGASWHAIEHPIPIVGDRSHGGSAWGGNPPAANLKAWQQLYHHATWLGLDFCRVEIEQRMYEPERGRFTWDAPEMRILYRILDWCEKQRVDVFFQQMWGNVAWNAFPEFREDPVKCVHSGPYSLTDYADGLVALMKHLLKTKRYTCIKWICINNEPGYDWSWWQQPPNQPMPLRPGLMAVRKAFDQAGITLPLSGPDWTDLPELKPEVVDFDDVIGAYDLHSYTAHFDWEQSNGYPLTTAGQRLRSWRQWTEARGKPLFLSEIGTMAYGWGGTNAGPATYQAAIKDAELVVRGLNMGVEGFNRWSFVNRGDLDGQWQMVDTWNPVSKTLRAQYTPHPNAYFVYGLISRFTAKHSFILTGEIQGGLLEGNQRVFAAALKSPQGNLTWIVVNDARQPWQATFKIEHSPRKILYKYQITQEQSEQSALKINPKEPVDLAPRHGTFEGMLPPMSLSIFSTFKLAHNAPGVIHD